jgi:Fe-Mn family superoxide dismutase
MFKITPLPYAFDSLEPYIDKETMEIHYTKHHQTYCNNLNAALEKHPDLFSKSLEYLVTNFDQLPDDIKTTVKNNAGGVYNHNLFWQMMTPDSPKKPIGKLEKAINQKFGSFSEFKELFNAAAKSRFGSGWAWLCVDQNGQLSVISTANQDSPLTLGLKPILGLDVWEHAYYLKFQNRRPDYIESWWNVVNWDYAESLFINQSN